MLKNLYLIVGQSGAGKTTIVETLRQRHGYRPLESYTDRAPRYVGETSHVFVTPEEFDSLGEMVAYTEFNGHRYGATQELVDDCDLYVIDPAGIRYMRERYKPNGRRIITIGLTASQTALRKRMAVRGDGEDAIQARLENDARMFEGMHDMCDVIIRNDTLEETLSLIESVIRICEEACV